jgi:hypothetical protein
MRSSLEVRSWIRVAFCQGASRFGGGIGAMVECSTAGIVSGR